MPERNTTSSFNIDEKLKYEIDLAKTDSEFIDLFYNFALGEVVEQTSAKLDDRTRLMCNLSILLGCQGTDEFRALLPVALRCGLTPTEIKEIIYQAVAYLGMGRVRPFLTATNDVFMQQGIPLPLPSTSTTNGSNRLEKGSQVQVDIFGEGMREFYKSGPENSRHINLWLADNCFGDYYTRKGLNKSERELITFCFIAAQGGCEHQLKAHIVGNINVGNDKDFLIAVISANIPYIGYPRSLNALACLREVTNNNNY